MNRHGEADSVAITRIGAGRKPCYEAGRRCHDRGTEILSMQEDQLEKLKLQIQRIALSNATTQVILMETIIVNQLLVEYAKEFDVEKKV